MAFAVSTTDQVNSEECAATDSLANSFVVIASFSPLARCRGCFLKIQNRLNHFSHSGLGCSLSISVNEGGIKQVSNYCPDPGEPENGKRIGSDFRCVSLQQPANARLTPADESWNLVILLFFSHQILCCSLKCNIRLSNRCYMTLLYLSRLFKQNFLITYLIFSSTPTVICQEQRFSSCVLKF